MNPQFKIDTYHSAVSNNSGTVYYKADILNANCICYGCCGGISSVTENKNKNENPVSAVRLVPFLDSHYSKGFIENICLLKVRYYYIKLNLSYFLLFFNVFI